MLLTMTTSPGCRQDLTIKVRECFSKRIIFLVGVRRRGRVDVNAVVDEELFEHFASSDQKVAIASLASELEGIL